MNLPTFIAQGRCTHHKLAKNEDGMMAVGGKTLGLTTTKPTDIIARIAKEPLPKGWPVLLVEAVTPDGSFKTTFLSGQGGAKGDSKPASKAVKPRDKAPTNPEAQPSTKPLEKQEKAESTQKGAEKALPTNAVTKSPQKTATSTESPFAVGDRVEVESYGEGIVRFVGSHHSTGNERVGVQLDRANGNNNGTIKGHTYFECPPKCGVLVAPSKCSKVDAVSLHATLPTEAPRTIHESTAQDQVVTLERPDTSASFGFGLAEVSSGQGIDCPSLSLTHDGWLGRCTLGGLRSGRQWLVKRRSNLLLKWGLVLLRLRAFVQMVLRSRSTSHESSLW
eukprot:m.14588 g.14588  ORF g.14588 m.14588 type:complete len:334 (+) comp4804_c0_seq1:483-1484(+)